MTIQGELHILPTDVLPTWPSFKAKTGPTRWSNQQEEDDQSKKHRSPQSRCQKKKDLLKVSGNTTCSQGLQPNPEYTNTRKTYPTNGIYLADS